MNLVCKHVRLAESLAGSRSPLPSNVGRAEDGIGNECKQKIARFFCTGARGGSRPPFAALIAAIYWVFRRATGLKVQARPFNM